MTKKGIKKVVKIGTGSAKMLLLMEIGLILGKADMIKNFIPLITEADAYDRYMSMICDSVDTLKNPITRTRVKLILITAGKYTRKES